MFIVQATGLLHCSAGHNSCLFVYCSFSSAGHCSIGRHLRRVILRSVILLNVISLRLNLLSVVLLGVILLIDIQLNGVLLIVILLFTLW